VSNCVRAKPPSTGLRQRGDIEAQMMASVRESRDLAGDCGGVGFLALLARRWSLPRWHCWQR
jgi:hypothetical protein